MNPDDTKTIARIKRAGIVAMLSGDLPLEAVLPVGDALLAAPVLAAVVGVQEAYNTVRASTIIADLRQRAGVNMLVGASHVETVDQLAAVIAAGAQFVVSARFEPTLMARCREAGILYMPGVISLFAAEAAKTAGCRAVQLTTGGPDGPDFVRTLCGMLPELDVVVAGVRAADEVESYVRAGAAAIIAGETLFTTPDQPMADIIIRARILQRAWEQTGRDDGEPPGLWLNPYDK